MLFDSIQWMRSVAIFSQGRDNFASHTFAPGGIWIPLYLPQSQSMAINTDNCFIMMKIGQWLYPCGRKQMPAMLLIERFKNMASWNLDFILIMLEKNLVITPNGNKSGSIS